MRSSIDLVIKTLLHVVSPPCLNLIYTKCQNLIILHYINSEPFGNEAQKKIYIA